MAATRGATGRRRGGAAGDLRRRNLSTVLETLHLGGPASRSELTAATGLNRSTIADLIGELGTLGLVEERAAPVASGPGRPSPVVHVRPEGAVALAIEVVVDSIGVATVGLGGHVYNRLRLDRSTDRFSPEETVQDVAKLAGPLLDSLPPGCRLVGVGVGVAGIVRRADGFVHRAPNLGWCDVPIAALLAAELGRSEPLLVANEADLGALAEYRRGVRPGTEHLLYLSGEVGIGCGAIVDGVPLLGAAGYAAEAGHTLINPEGRQCRCGARGCWETEAGELALLRRAGVGSGAGGIDEVAARAAVGDRSALQAIAEVGRWLGLGIGDLINLFNPELVVLGGVYERLFSLMEPAIAEGVGLRALAAPASMVAIVRSGLGEDASLLGAAELVLSGVVADPARRRRRTAGAAAAGAGTG
jgi:predicted NBD/HSP70 family sugar kinase